MKEWKFSIIVVFFEVLKRAVVRTPDLQRILQQMPAKYAIICQYLQKYGFTDWLKKLIKSRDYEENS